MTVIYGNSVENDRVTNNLNIFNRNGLDFGHRPLRRYNLAAKRDGFLKYYEKNYRKI